MAIVYYDIRKRVPPDGKESSYGVPGEDIRISLDKVTRGMRVQASDARARRSPQNAAELGQPAEGRLREVGGLQRDGAIQGGALRLRYPVLGLLRGDEMRFYFSLFPL